VPSLSTIRLVSHREHPIEVFEREADSWRRTKGRRSANVRIDAPDGDLFVDHLWRRHGYLVGGIGCRPCEPLAARTSASGYPVTVREHGQ